MIAKSSIVSLISISISCDSSSFLRIGCVFCFLSLLIADWGYLGGVFVVGVSCHCSQVAVVKDESASAVFMAGL